VRDCDFCGIVRGEQPAQIVYETGTVLAFLPLNAVAPGHTLVIPRLHTPDFLSCPAPLAGALSAAAAHVGRAVRAAVAADGMNLITSAGAAASQTVFHLHVHLVPRWDGDALGRLWPLPSAATSGPDAAVAGQIRRSLASLTPP
jgi:histidine triad (HIT) family protein